MKNLLITGANGQLGSQIKALSNNYNNFKFCFTDVENLDISIENNILDFCNSNNIDFIINCAAYTAVDKAEEDYENAFKINVTGVKNLRNAAQKNGIPLIHISTDYVFDGKNYKPYTEDNQTNPVSVYGKTKLQGEKELYNYKKAIIIRTAWLYSIYGNNFAKTIIKLAKKNNEIKVVSDQVGSPTNAIDLADAILSIVEKIFNEKNINAGIYHYSNEGVCSWFDFAKEIVDNKKLKTRILPVNSEVFPRPAPRPFYSVLNKTKIKNTFNILVPYWRTSLKKWSKKVD